MPEGSVGPAPEWFSSEQKLAWDYAVTNAPDGVLFACDRGALEVYIVAQDHHRLANIGQQKLDSQAGPDGLTLLVTTNETVKVFKDGTQKKTGGGNIIQSPYLGIMSSAGARMLRAAAELGFTPAARPRLKSGDEYDPARPPQKAPSGKPTPRGEKTERTLDALIGQRASLN